MNQHDDGRNNEKGSAGPSSFFFRQSRNSFSSFEGGHKGNSSSKVPPSKGD
ncbi:MAG TPA: hypothetical protein VJ964_02145 [Balneolaceae bacterium]|nr:hypothetical protein [Balneolaceae bacterium]